jgi:hypothetical protein
MPGKRSRCQSEGQDHDAVDVRAEWRPRWIRQWILTGVFFALLAGGIVAMGVLYGFDDDPPPDAQTAGGILLSVLIAAAVGFSWWNCRCPSCSTFLMRYGFYARVCPSCDARLR